MYSFNTSNQEVKELARDRWVEILTNQGIDASFLSGKHSPCPMCGGKDRFRFSDKRRGFWVCNQCTNGKFHDGFNLISAYQNIKNNESFKLVAKYLEAEKIFSNKVRRKYDDVSFKANNESTLLAKKKIGSEHAKNILTNCKLATHKYLLEKGIDQQALVLTKTYMIGKQIIRCGALIVSMYDIENTEQLINIQFINKDQSRGYIAGSSIHDGIHFIQGNDDLPYVAIVEGYATGLSIFLATNATTIVAFDCNGLESKAKRIQTLYPDKTLIFFGDNDRHKGHKKGEEAAHKAATLVKGFAIIPPQTGDWDDYRKTQGIDTTKREIEQQLLELKAPIEINDKCIGLSIRYSILLATKVGVSFSEALSDHVGSYCICPLSGGKAIINVGAIFSFELKRLIIPILVHFFNKTISNECYTILGTKNKLKWLFNNKTQQHLYAFVQQVSYRVGADIPSYELLNDWLDKKIGFTAVKEILEFIKFKTTLRNHHSKTLILLNPKEFTHHIELKQENGRLNWNPALEAAFSGQYKLIAIKAQHGQGKTEEFIKTISAGLHSVDKPVYVAHRTKLIAQAAKTLNFYHYEDDRKIIRSYGSPNLACCLHSFKHDHFLRILQNAHSIFFDEASQVLKALYTDRNIHPDLPERIAKASIGSFIYLLDADLTTKDILNFKQLFGINENDILVITAESPKRILTAKISISSAPAHYKTPILKSIMKNLRNNIPCVLAVESETTARAVYGKLKKDFDEKNIVLLTGKTPAGISKPFIDDINNKMAHVDLLIHTSVIGTGVSIRHENKRFIKGYALFSGITLSATEALQMMRRCRDVNQWEVGILCSPPEMYMSNFFKDVGADALKKKNIVQNSILEEIRFNAIKNKSFFIHIFLWLLKNEYGFTVIEQLPHTDKIQGLMTNTEVRESDIKEFLTAVPSTLNQALLSRKIGYHNHEEQIRSEAAFCMEYFRISKITKEAAELWCNPVKRQAIEKMEYIIKILNFDNSINDVQQKAHILYSAGIRLNLFKDQIINQDEIKIMRDDIASQSAELVGLGLLQERYVEKTKIPKDKMITFISKFLVSIGFNVTTQRIRKQNRTRVLNIHVPQPIATRLKLDVRSDKIRLRDNALELRSKGLGYGEIAKKLGIESKQHARRLINSLGV